jgi:hypothetical protein
MDIKRESPRERALIWQVTPHREGFACSACSWTFPNLKDLTEREHDPREVYTRFYRHVCRREIELKKAGEPDQKK